MDASTSITILLSSLALVISIFALRAALQANRATIFDQRFAVYRDAEKFIGSWARAGKPNLDELRLLIDAWNRSHFLFDASVTAYLRQLWLDAVQASNDVEIINGEQPGDRNAAIERKYSFLRKYCGDEGSLRNAFRHQLKI